MIQTRTRSVSDRSEVPTHGLGVLRSRSNSAAISAGHTDLSDFSACLSNMVRAMAFLRDFGRYIAAFDQCREPEVRTNFVASAVASFGFKSGTRIIELLVSL